MIIENKFENYVINRKEKVKISSKDINRGDIFIALKGKNIHGNFFLESAIKKGAKFCVTDNDDFKPHNKIILVRNIFQYLSKLAVKKRSIYNGKVIGITGSAGKTTLKETLAYFLKQDHIISYSKESHNNELGVLISLLNMNLKSSYSIFELGTNNFGEIKHLTKLVKPSEVFITNIQSTHLENFETQDNIAREKSDIFKFIYNSNRKNLYLNINSKSEKIILNIAKKQKKLKIVQINDLSTKYFIKNILKNKDTYKILFSINNKNINLQIKFPVQFRLINLLFCYAFFDQNLLNTKTISKKQKYLKPVDGRGLAHLIKINNKKINLIDESYNANPDTMRQSINYFNNIKIHNLKKILVLGNMNELGKISNKMHTNLLYYIDKFKFKSVVLCGEFFRRSIKKICNPKNEFIYLENKIKIMKYLNKEVHNNDIILIKCSNSTEINALAKNLLKRR